MELPTTKKELVNRCNQITLALPCQKEGPKHGFPAQVQEGPYWEYIEIDACCTDTAKRAARVLKAAGLVSFSSEDELQIRPLSGGRQTLMVRHILRPAS